MIGVMWRFCPELLLGFVYFPKLVKLDCFVLNSAVWRENYLVVYQNFQLCNISAALKKLRNEHLWTRLTTLKPYGSLYPVYLLRNSREFICLLVCENAYSLSNVGKSEFLKGLKITFFSCWLIRTFSFFLKSGFVLRLRFGDWWILVWSADWLIV